MCLYTELGKENGNRNFLCLNFSSAVTRPQSRGASELGGSGSLRQHRASCGKTQQEKPFVSLLLPLPSLQGILSSRSERQSLTVRLGCRAGGASTACASVPLRRACSLQDPRAAPSSKDSSHLRKKKLSQLFQALLAQAVPKAALAGFRGLTNHQAQGEEGPVLLHEDSRESSQQERG